MSFNFEQESCHDEFIILKQNQLLMDSRPIRFLYLEGYMALKSTFFSLWHHRRLICFIKQSRKRENSNLWKGFANQKRIWKCWQMVVSPDVSRRCWLESVSSVSLQNIFPAKYSFFNFQCTFKWDQATIYIGFIAPFRLYTVV